jgi:ribose transport system ATP-binding protein
VSEATQTSLEVRRLSKAFGGVQALSRVDLTVRPGEVHGLVGENGSGKSTLIKILAGYHLPDDGEVAIFGKPLAFPFRRGEPRSLGLAFVHQDLALVPSLTVLENLIIGKFATSGGLLPINWQSEVTKAAAMLARYGLHVSPLASVNELSVIDRARLAIVRAIEGILEHHGGILILDEPTVFLPRADRQQLFGLIRGIVRAGSSVILVSHDLNDIRDVADRVTVLRDGAVIGTVITSEVSDRDLVNMILGQELSLPAPAAGATASTTPEPDTYVDDLSGPHVHGVSLHFRRGEVLGLTGLAGSGFEEVPYLLVGATRASGGLIRRNGAQVDLTQAEPFKSLQSGFALIPADRQRDGSIGSLSAAENIVMLSLNRFFVGFHLSKRRIGEHSMRLSEAFDIRPRLPHLDYALFSGGNQQKILMAKWLQLNPSLLLLHEPTQGVDIGARQQIFLEIRKVAMRGAAVVCASTDYAQMAAICDRVNVFAGGRVVAELSGDHVTEREIATTCYTTEPDTKRGGLMPQSHLVSEEA